jgi:hypothetical protein
VAVLIAGRDLLNPKSKKRLTSWKRQSWARLKSVRYLASRFAVTVLTALVLPTGARQVSAQANTSSEYQVKAAFLFHFAQFVDWPPQTFKDASSPLIYCTVGEDPFQGALETSLSGKTIGSHPLRVQHFKGTEDIRGCQVLFIAAEEKKREAAALVAVKGNAVLTVGETEHFTEEGGMIGFRLEENKIRFAINLDAAEKAKLKISARLLALAKTVIGGPKGT